MGGVVRDTIFEGGVHKFFIILKVPRQYLFVLYVRV
jgi:hypothetical protein